MFSKHDTIETKSLEDFVFRMQRGTAFYAMAWFAPALVFRFYLIYPAFFWGTSIFSIITTFFRWYVCKRIQKDVFNKTQQKTKLAITAAAASSLLWGFIYAFVLAHPELENSLLGITIITGMIVASASTLLSIYTLASKLAQLLILIPGILIIFYQYFFTTEHAQSHVFLGFALAVACFYLRQVSNTAGTDYINATKNQLLAESRAERMEYLSVRDPLTKLKNRLFFDSYLEESWFNAKTNTSMISVMMIDLDHFKKVNDTHGHLIGDECLRAIAKALKSNLRKEGDHLARFGGEEFILCLQQSTPQGALLIAERLLKCVKDTEIIVKNKTILLTCSIGLASMSVNESSNIDDLLVQADNALYKAKRNGRNQIAVSPPKEIPLQDAKKNLYSKI